MFDDIFDFDCDECGGPGPPPKFMIPPPPRPPFMQELLKCRDEQEINSSSYVSRSSSSSSSSKINSNNIFYNSKSDIDVDNSDMCEAIPILDASYHSSPSLQTSAIIAVFSLLLVLVVLISSLFVWKHKRKVQNFLPCKTTTRGPHIGGGGGGGVGINGGHSVTYEDPDAHLGHRPLMMTSHSNIQMLSKSVHYPSGYPMTRSPPHLVCNSPGPDPYRSNDNVYEELDPARGSDNESEQIQSDDDFAGDELSLPDERNLNKLSPESKSIGLPVSTIYHEQRPCSNQQTNGNERNSLLKSSSSSYNQSQNQRLNNTSIVGSRSANTNSTTSRLGILSGVFRNTTGRNNKCNTNDNNMHENNRNRCQNHRTLPHNQGELNRLAIDEQNSRQQNNLQSDVVLPQSQLIYDDAASRNNLMQLAYNHSGKFPASISSSNILNTNRINNLHGQHCYKTLESDVERRNRINQLHHTPISIPPVATIFRGKVGERINYNQDSRYPQPYYTSQPNSLLSIQKSRMNPRSLDRRRIFGTNNPEESNYGYSEPVFHESLLYGLVGNNNLNNDNVHNHSNITTLRQAYPTYVLPGYTTATTNTAGSYRPFNNQLTNHFQPAYNQQQYFFPQNNMHDLNQQQIYSRDSSFGSDSGYSHQTSSSIGNGRNNCPNNIHNNNNNNNSNVNEIRTPTPSVTPTNLSLPSTDSGCITNGPSSLNSLKLPTQSNCDKDNSLLNNAPFGWARTKTANLNSNYKKSKDNNSTSEYSLDLASIGNCNLNTSKQTDRSVSGIKKPNNHLEVDYEIMTDRTTIQNDNEKASLNNNSNNCLSSSPNTSNNDICNKNTNINLKNNNNNNNNLTNIISRDLNETNQSINNNDCNNSFKNINNNSNNSNSCISQS